MNYSIRWSAIKALFSKQYLQEGGKEEKRNSSRQRKGEAAVWQRRYWEHCIRDEQDFKKHFDYIHYNPVKHNYVTNACEWKWSSFHKYKAKGYYPDDWGINDIKLLDNNDEFGE